MTDYFALLSEPRRPWLDAERLKSRFHDLSLQWHPDRFHHAPIAERQAAHERFGELNAAYHCLREPKPRLRHLLELEGETGLDQVQNVSPDLIDLFAEIGAACREVRAADAEKAGASSSILRAQQLEAALGWSDRFSKLEQKINAYREPLLAELQRLDPRWTAAPPPGSAARRSALPLARTRQIYQALGFLDRWLAQVQERLLPLNL
ncbi:MAG: DnaJ domain-containing protein [Verrucomicrobia bacterium]|nr:DnaJ domain-containing protein [Verrucomicrobiota bacterium]